MPILVFLGLSVLDFGPMYATDRQRDVRRASSLNAPYPRGGGIKSVSQEVDKQVFTLARCTGF